MNMLFGKFKGRDLTELEDSYLQWLISLPNLRDPLAAAVRSELEARGAEDAEPATQRKACPDPKVAVAIIDAGVCALAQDRAGNPVKTTKINACAAWLRAQLRGGSS